METPQQWGTSSEIWVKGRVEHSQRLTDLWRVFLLLQQPTLCIFPWLSSRQDAGCSDAVLLCFFLYNGKETQANSWYWYEALVRGSRSWACSVPTVSRAALNIQLGRVNWSQSLWHQRFFLFPFWSSILLMIKHRLSQLRDSRAAESEII